ncbi:hypothetical protein MOKP125_13530 [Mycobacterium avium subsp. hominissuis]
MASGHPQHGGELGQKRAGVDGPGPHVAPAALQLIGQRGNDIGVAGVSVQNLDRGAVAIPVDVGEHGGRRLVIVRRRRALGHRQFEADREVEFLRVAGADPLSASFQLERLEPCCGSA